MTRSDTAAIRLEGVTKTYTVGEPIDAVHEVSLEITRGSFTAVMGPSGSGKSTLMHLIGLLEAPTRGTIVIDDQDTTRLGEHERTRLRGREIGFVFQTFNLMPKLTVLENVALPMMFQGRPADERDARAHDLLERVGLETHVRHKPAQLSGGQRQRVAIARALANEPTLLLADEPTGNLDSKSGAQVMALFGELHDQGHTLMIVTHQRQVVDGASRIIHLADGEIAEIETVGAAS